MYIRRGKLWFDRFKFGAQLILVILAIFFILSYRSITEIPKVELFILIFIFGVFCCFLAATAVYARIEKIEEKKTTLLLTILFYLFLALISISYSFTLAESIFGARAQVFFTKSIRAIISGFYSSLFVLTILREVHSALSEVEKEYEKRIELIREGNDLEEDPDNPHSKYQLESLLDFLFKSSITQLLLIFCYNLMLLFIPEAFLMSLGFTFLSQGLEILKEWFLSTI
ncbi:MAG: hypothetical protein ACFFCD_04145 [Promethearchaeota archaeon]